MQERRLFLFFLIFIYNIVIIIVVVIWWSVNHCSFAFIIDYLWLFLLLIIFDVFLISINLYFNYKKYKDEGTTLSQINEENKIFPFAISEYINSNINLDNLLENEIYIIDNK